MVLIYWKWMVQLIEKMWKKSLIHSNINVGPKIVAYVLINDGKYKMQLLSNGFNMLIVDNLKNTKKIINPL